MIQLKYFLTIFLLFVLHTACTPEGNAEQNELSRTFPGKANTVDQFADKIMSTPADITAIFDRINAVAYTQVYNPQLAIIKTDDRESISKLTPQALADGSIIISDKVTAKIREYAATNPDLFEPLMAFTIGHELAHFVHNDFKFLLEKSEPRYEDKYKKDIEFRADKTGFLYAAFSGYKVGLLIKHERIVKQFLSLFFETTNRATVNNDGTYPTPKERAAQTMATWKTLHRKYPFYEYGVRLSIFNQCNDAIFYFFDEFRHTYQGKELQNNIGACYLQLAKADMQDAAYFYWLPNILDGDIESIITMGSTVTDLKNLKSARLIEKVKGNLEEAIRYFGLAIDTAPYYLPSYLNLATSHLYLGDPDSAGLTLNKGLKQYEKLGAQQRDSNIEIRFKMLRLIAQYENTWISSAPLQNITSGLKQILQDYENPPLEVQFNLARLLEVGDRAAEAQEHWNKLSEIRSQLPRPILEVVCNEQQSISACLKLNKTSENTKQWPAPEEWTQYQGRGIIGAMHKNDWKKRLNETWYKMQVSIYQSPDAEWEALFFDGYPILLINRTPNETFETLSQYCPYTLRQKNIVEGDVYLCENWAAKVVNGKVTEVWTHM
ncbi:hypothetical protein [Candidatus Albibeggiatoa sp. nov. BB20]|uniref:hypothetical protein n=1 Tax=Candidatus Albibeggiatoa sp. nov. BB20 TaxID=3162723 RepID=UPI0033659057